MNTLQMSYKLYNFTLAVRVSTLRDNKLTPHKTAHFEVSRHNILLLNSKNDSAYELIDLFLQVVWVVFKISAFCTDTRCQTADGASD